MLDKKAREAPRSMLRLCSLRLGLLRQVQHRQCKYRAMSDIPVNTGGITLLRAVDAQQFTMNLHEQACL
jgi:hypothetical protein